MKNEHHLPIYGVGTVYVIVIILATIIAVILGHNQVFRGGMAEKFRSFWIIAGILLILCGVCLWYGAVFGAKVDEGITENKLITTGVYSHVRNPIYSAFMLFCTGALLISGNVYFYPLFFFYWIFMSVLMKCTEEKWLKNLHGGEYEEYCRRVNRCIPWFAKK